MARSSDIYWEAWQKLLEAAANIQGLKPPFDSWHNIKGVCEEISVALGHRLGASCQIR